MNQAFLDYYRCPDCYADFRHSGADPPHEPGYFRFGPEAICYGKCDAVPCMSSETHALHDVLSVVRIEGRTCFLPFDLDEVITNFRHEHYLTDTREKSSWKNALWNAYYHVRPGLPVGVRRFLQRVWLKGWERTAFPSWPVDCSVERILEKTMGLALQAHQSRVPFIWFWPEGKPSCAIMTHDVETASGLNSCTSLMDIDDSFAIKSSFQFIPRARYTVPSSTLDGIRRRGFEINVHDLFHDGFLYRDQDKFRQKAAHINEAMAKFSSKGFRAGCLYRNLDWYGAFSFSYDMSAPNVAHLEPQPGGCCTVTPFFAGNVLELPLTTVEDYSLFHILRSCSTELWRQQIEMVMQCHGLVSFLVHPDYLDTTERKGAYHALLQHIQQLRAEKNFWITLPGEVDTWWRQRSKMQIVPDGSGWKIDGPGAERARLAYASLEQGKVVYSLN